MKLRTTWWLQWDRKVKSYLRSPSRRENFKNDSFWKTLVKKWIKVRKCPMGDQFCFCGKSLPGIPHVRYREQFCGVVLQMGSPCVMASPENPQKGRVWTPPKNYYRNQYAIRVLRSCPADSAVPWSLSITDTEVKVEFPVWYSAFKHSRLANGDE